MTQAPGKPASNHDVAVARARLARIGQEHLLAFWDALGPGDRATLLEQVGGLDPAEVAGLVERFVRREPVPELPGELEPAPFYPRDPATPGREWDAAAARAAGEALLRAGQVAAFTVAGGQGTRLGFDGPKGLFPAGPVTGKPLFAIFAEGVLAARRRYGAPIPWYIMTSPLNHAATVEFFGSQRFFGLPADEVRFFPQGVLPSFEMGTGRVLLAAKGELATNPDGHGGAVRALAVSGSIADMRARGVRHLSYFQVDNPLVRVVDPVFLGLHAAAPGSSGEMSSKMVPKVSAEEKLGVFCSVAGRVRVVEYSDLPQTLARERKASGGLRFAAGSIAVHVIGVEFLERLATDTGFELPYHRALKKVPHVDPETGRTVTPPGPNAVKLEKFIFDALPLCRASLIYETDRAEEFAPIKNPTGVDSAESSRQLQSERAARWLAAAGVAVPRRADGTADCVLEISPLTALEPGDLRGAKLPARVERGARLAL